MKASIYCEAPRTGGLDFYLKVGCESYYLFNQRWKQAVEDHFKNGISVDQALKAARGKSSVPIRSIAEKLPSYIRYIEKEYDIVVLEKSKRRAIAC